MRCKRSLLTKFVFCLFFFFSHLFLHADGKIEPVVKLHGCEKSMILGPLERSGAARPDRADGGLPRRAAEGTRRSSGPSQCEAGEQSELVNEEARSQEVPKGRFYAPKSFATGSTVLITGGAGFIGSNFVEYMYEKHPDYHLIVLDALTYSSTIENIPEQIRNSPRFLFVHGSICDENLVDQLLEKADFVVHLAAETDVTRSISDDKVFFETNVMGTRTLMHGLVKHANKVKRFIHVSSSEVYGTCEKDEIDEEHSLKPMSPYAASKTGADRMVFAYGCTYRAPVVILRFFNNYGPRQHVEKVVAKFITLTINNEPTVIHGSGEQLRDWLYVADTARAIDAALHVEDFESIRNQVINCGTGKSTSILTIADIIHRHLSRPTDLIHTTDRPGQVFKHLSSTEKAKKLLGWEAKTTFNEGMVKTIQWYKKHPEFWKKALTDDQIRKDNSVLISEKIGQRKS